MTAPIIWLVLLAGVFLTQASVVPIPQIGSSDSVWPHEIPVGNADTMVEVRGSGFVPSSVIQVNGQDVPTAFTRLNGPEIRLLTGSIPRSFLNEPKLLELRVFNPYGGASAPVRITVKARTQPARLQIELSTVSAGQQDHIDVTVQLTNEGTDSFYVPVRITPFTGGNMLNSYHFEVQRPSDLVFTDAVQGYADGFFPKTTYEEELLRSGQIALVRPGETFSGTARFHVDGFANVNEAGPPQLPRGRYVVRMRFDPRAAPGSDKFRTKFLTETVLSNAVLLTIN
jgi:hypothetical protein